MPFEGLPVVAVLGLDFLAGSAHLLDKRIGYHRLSSMSSSGVHITGVSMTLLSMYSLGFLLGSVIRPERLSQQQDGVVNAGAQSYLPARPAGCASCPKGRWGWLLQCTIIDRGLDRDGPDVSADRLDARAGIEYEAQFLALRQRHPASEGIGIVGRDRGGGLDFEGD